MSGSLLIQCDSSSLEAAHLGDSGVNVIVGSIGGYCGAFLNAAEAVRLRDWLKEALGPIKPDMVALRKWAVEQAVASGSKCTVLEDAHVIENYALTGVWE